MPETELCTMTDAFSYAVSQREREEEAFCKFCYSFENPLGHTDDLISPCGCKGSIKYVHRHCLRVWRFKGKSLKDIKTCEQCSYPYALEDELKAPKAVVFVSSLISISALLLLANVLLVSTADTAAFIAGDISRALNSRQDIDGSFLGNKTLFVCDMAGTTSRDERGNKKRARLGQTLVYGGREEGPKGLFHRLLKWDKHDVFPTIVSLSLFYQLALDLQINLLVNFLFSIWRILVFGSVADLFVFCLLNTYIYLKLFNFISIYIDSFYTYVLNYRC
jgi:RING-variant domain